MTEKFKIDKIWFDLYTGENDYAEYDDDEDHECARTIIHTLEKNQITKTICGSNRITIQIRKELHRQLDQAIDKTNKNLEKLGVSNGIPKRKKE